MTDRRDRSDRLRKRFDDDADDESSDPSVEESGDAGSSSSDGSDTAAASGSESGGPQSGEDPSEDAASVKDRPSVLMYLPEETRQELDVRFDELNARYKRAHGEPLEKNRDYYPAVIEAGLENRSLEEILDL